MSTYIAIDFGGTHIKGALMNDNGDFFEEKDVPTPKTKEDIINALCDFSKLAKKDTVAVGLGIAGPIDKNNGIIYPPNIKELDGFNITNIEEKFNLPIYIENDANCFALAESRFGVGKNHKNAIFITLGTGIGGGIMVNGEIIEGKDGAAGEIGHIVIDAFSNEFSSGIKGSLENMASGTAIGRRCGCSAYEASIKASNGDLNAKKSFSLAGKYMGIGFASLANIFNPEIFIIGGSVIKSKEFFEEEMRKEFKDRCMMPAGTAEIKFSKLKEPGIIGAGVTAIEMSKKNKI